MNKYTVFCRQLNREGTTWISEVEADTPELAQSFGMRDCMADWGWSEEDYGAPDECVECFCVIEGSVNILLFED